MKLLSFFFSFFQRVYRAEGGVALIGRVNVFTGRPQQTHRKKERGGRGGEGKHPNSPFRLLNFRVIFMFILFEFSTYRTKIDFLLIITLTKY